MRRGLGVDRHSVRAGSNKVVEVPLRLYDHEVNVERQPGELTHGLDDLRTEREVRYEATIHDVDVNPVGASGLAHRDLIGELREVGAEDRRSNTNTHGARPGAGEPVLTTIETALGMPA